MAQKIPDMSDSGGEIRQFLNTSEFNSLVKGLGIIDSAAVTKDDISESKLNSAAEYVEAKLSRFASLTNQEIHEYRRQCELLGKKKAAKESKRTIDFGDELKKTASRFRTLFANAPHAIAINEELEEISELLRAVPLIIDELKDTAQLVGPSMINPYGGTEMGHRIDLILGLRALYSHFTSKKDWVTSDAYDDDRYTTPFFQILRLCYVAAGLKKADSTIAANITEAKRVGQPSV